MLTRSEIAGEVYLTVLVPVTATLRELVDALVSAGLDVEDPEQWFGGNIQPLGDLYSANIYQDISWLAEGEIELAEMEADLHPDEIAGYDHTR